MTKKILCLAAFLSLSLGLSAAPDVVLENSSLKMNFTTDAAGKFCFKEFVVAGQNRLPENGSTAVLWKLSLLGPRGETPEFTPDYAQFLDAQADRNTATFIWAINIDRCSDWRVVVKVYLSPDSQLPQWSISASLPEGWIVTSLEFPRITVRKAEDATLIVSAGYGAEYQLPAGASIESRYPSVTGGMEMILSPCSEGTYYMAADDRDGCGKYFRATAGKDALTLVQMVPASFEWSQYGRFALPWSTTLAFNPASWQDTVLDWYRPFTFTTKWGFSTLEERNIVPWIVNADIWLRPKNIFPEVVAALRKGVDYYGAGTGVHWYHWHHNAYDTLYPDYFPPREGWPELVKEIQGKGAHITPYINGRLWDPATPSYVEDKGYEASCRKMDGTLYTEIYPTSNVSNTVTCPSSPIWQAKIKYNTQTLLNEFGTHGVYIDQIGAAASEPCYAENHPHAKGGGGWWPEAYRQVLGEIRAECTGSQALTTEENAECYLDLFDMMLIVNTPHSPEVHMVPLFPLVYSDRCVYSGLNYYSQTLNDGSFLYINGRSLLWGAQLGWIQPEWLFAKGNDAEIRYLKTLGAFRKANHDLFFGGRFLEEVIPTGDNPTFTIWGGETFPSVMGARWSSVKGGDAYVLVNMSGKGHKVTLPNGRTVYVNAYNALRVNL